MSIQKLKSRKAESDAGVSERVTKIVLIVLVVALVLFGLYKVGFLNWVKNLPVFGVNDETNIAGGSSNQCNALSYKPVVVIRWDDGFWSRTDNFYFWFDNSSNTLKIFMILNGKESPALNKKWSENWHSDANENANFRELKDVSKLEKTNVEFIMTSKNKSDFIHRLKLVSDLKQVNIGFGFRESSKEPAIASYKNSGSLSEKEISETWERAVIASKNLQEMADKGEIK